MWTTIIKILLKIATSKVAEEVVAIGVKKLLDSKDSGIGKDLAQTMINGIAISKTNPTSLNTFNQVFKVLK